MLRKVSKLGMIPVERVSELTLFLCLARRGYFWKCGITLVAKASTLS